MLVVHNHDREMGEEGPLMSTTVPSTATIDDVIKPSQRRELTVWKLCAWSGPLFIVAFLGVWPV